PLAGMTESRNPKLAAELANRDDPCGDDIPGLKQVLVARDEEICVSDQRRSQKRSILGITREVGHIRRTADVHRPHPEQFGPTLEGLLVQVELGAPQDSMSSARISG